MKRETNSFFGGEGQAKETQGMTVTSQDLVTLASAKRHPWCHSTGWKSMAMKTDRWSNNVMAASFKYYWQDLKR